MLVYILYDEDVYYVNVYKLRLFKDFVMCNYIGCFCVDFDIFGLDYIFILIQIIFDYIFCSNFVCSYVNIYYVYEEGLFSFIFDYFFVLMFIDI